MTKYRKPTLFTLCTFFAVVAFCQDIEWKEYAYAEEGFAISSPVEPRIEKRTMKPVAGEVEAHFYFIPLENSQMVVMYAPLHPNDKRTAEQALKDAQNGITLSGAKLISQKTISLGKYPGLELEAEDEQNRQRGRFYAVDRKMYTLAVAWPKGKPFPAEGQRWYDSFRLVSAGTTALRNKSPRPARLRVSQGVMDQSRIYYVKPVYSGDPQKQGDVTLSYWVDKSGAVGSVSAIDGDPMLAQAAIEAVKQWKYKPYLLDGEPIEVETRTVVSFGK